MGKKLEDVLEDYQNIRESFRYCSQNGDSTKEVLLEFQGRFTDLKADLRPIHNKIVKEWTSRDDKASTAIKYRIAYAIHKGTLDGYEPCSLAQAEKLSAGSEKYKDFLNQRVFWRESLNNINDLRDDISSYIIEISNRLKNMY